MGVISGGGRCRPRPSAGMVPVLMSPQIGTKRRMGRGRMKTVTIESTGRAVIALDAKDGARVAFRKRYCNPAALAQLVCDVEGDGYVIDWENSTVAKPEPEPVLPTQAPGERPAQYVNHIIEPDGFVGVLSRPVRVF